MPNGAHRSRSMCACFETVLSYLTEVLSYLTEVPKRVIRVFRKSYPIIASVVFSFVAIYMLTVSMVVISLSLNADSKVTDEAYQTAIVANSIVISLAIVFLASVIFTAIGEYLVIIVRHLLLDMVDKSNRRARQSPKLIPREEETEFLPLIPHKNAAQQWRFE